MDGALSCTVWSLVLGCAVSLRGWANVPYLVQHSPARNGVVHLAVGWTWPCVGMGGCLVWDFGLHFGWVVAALALTTWFGGPQNWGPPGWTSLGAIVSNQ